MPDLSPNEVTKILKRSGTGDDSAVAELLPLVYSDLRAMAGHCFRGQRSDHTLQPTALVHEAFIKLARQAGSDWKDRAHFFAVASRAMRQILTDHARGRGTAKRGGDRKRVTLDSAITPIAADDVELTTLSDLLTELEKLDERQARVVEMRFLAGMTVKEVAHVLGVSTFTVEDEWRSA